MYLAGLHSDGPPTGRLSIYFSEEEQMRLYFALSGNSSQCPLQRRPDLWSSVYMLESFHYIQPWQIELLPRLRGFMLDSGAYTFMRNVSGSGIDWDAYVGRYIDFINEHQIDQFIELDIDSVVGIQQVERYRTRIERETGKQCIPVWHKSRGLSYLRSMAKDYKLIAIGGLAIRVIQKNEYKYLPKLIDIVHQEGCQIHGLGFSNLRWIKRLRWDSVDTASWVYGNIGGYVVQFKNGTLHKIKAPTRIKSRETAQHNFLEWIKFALFMEENY